MQKEYKNIISIFLLITGLVILSHSILPHDHHYNYLTQENHNEHSEKDDSGHEPIHCHFLNEVILTKITISQISNIQYVSAANSLLRICKLDDSNLSVLPNTIADSYQLYDYIVFIDSSPTRGSPLV